MDYPYFYRLYYEKALNRNVNEVYDQRLHSIATQVFPFSMYPSNKKTDVPAYFTHNLGTTQLVSQIYIQDKKTDHLVRRLPGIVQSALVRDIFAEELFHTNEIEGVKSTKEQFVRSARLLENKKEPTGRFTRLVKTYYRLISGEVDTPTEPGDVRTFYDLLVADEIEENELPDGKWFRTEPTYLYKGTKSGKPIHVGMTPEQQIIDAVKTLLQFLNAEDVPLLIRVAVGHYYFGYIHPFYDGNGRTSRFISSLYMKEEFHTLTALSLSRACNLNRSQYLEAFEKTNDVSMQGEMNFFIDRFLGLFLETQVRMNEELRRNLYRFEAMKYALQEEPFLSKHPKHHEIIYILSWHEIFSEEAGLLTPDLVRIASESNHPLGEATARATVTDLVRQGFVEVEKVGRYNMYQLSSSFRERVMSE
ncbi:fic/DOC family protein [Exiguobacterium sp. S17]|nr:fic/DOC family protein [Exiguobacterium sp. S17]